MILFFINYKLNNLKMKAIRNLFISKDQRVKEKLSLCTYQNTSEFGFNNKSFWGKCVKVYDGDTIHCAVLVCGETYRIRIRLHGIDTAELRSNNVDEVAHAKRAKAFLENTILDHMIYIKCSNDSDKYGRVLATLFHDKNDTKSINDILVEKKYAYKYDGGKKLNFEDWYKNDL